MRTLRIILILSAVFFVAISPPMYAWAAHGGWGHGHGGWHYGGHYGWGYHGGYYPYWHYPYYWGWGGVYLGWPYVGWPYGVYAGYPYMGWPYSPPAVTEAPQPYTAPDQQPPEYWYYCQNPQGYYPYVKSCPGGWIPVVPDATPPAR